MEETNKKEQEKLFYEKLIYYEKEYIKSNFNIKNQEDGFLDNKIKEMENLIFEFSNFKREAYKQESINPENKYFISHETMNFNTSLKSIYKKLKKLSREEGGFIFMPYRFIFYNFYKHYFNNETNDKDFNNKSDFQFFKEKSI